MSALSKISKIIGNSKSVPATIGIVLFVFAILAGIIFIGGAILIGGLNLMGLEIPYTFKTIIGASIVILSLRSYNVGKKEQ